MAKFNFMQEYKGPHGPHLFCLTHYSKTREYRETKHDSSIHPYGRASGYSTMKNKRQTTLRRAIAGTLAHMERHPNDMVAGARAGNFQRRLDAIA